MLIILIICETFVGPNNNEQKKQTITLKFVFTKIIADNIEINCL